MSRSLLSLRAPAIYRRHGDASNLLFGLLPPHLGFELSYSSPGGAAAYPRLPGRRSLHSGCLRLPGRELSFPARSHWLASSTRPSFSSPGFGLRIAAAPRRGFAADAPPIPPSADARAVAEAFALLKLNLEADPSEVKATFRRRAMETHPDVNTSSPDPQGDFVRLTEAFRVASEHAHYMAQLRAHRAANPQHAAQHHHSGGRPMRPHFAGDRYWYDVNTVPFNPREVDEMIESMRFEMRWNDETIGNSGPDWGGYFWMMQMQGADADNPENTQVQDARGASHVREDRQHHGKDAKESKND